MTLAEPEQRKPCPPGQPMPQYGFSGILGTGRIKTAGRRQQRRKQLLIQPDYKERDALEHGDVPICLNAFSSSRCTPWKSMVADSRRAMTFMSAAGSNSRLCLYTSLMQRFTLLRITAQPIFLLTVTPRRGRARSFSCQTRRNPLTANLPAESESPTKSARFRSRADLGNVRTEGACSQEAGLLGCNANGQVLATLGPSALDDETPVFCGHPHQKAVGPLAGSIARLKCSFHICTPDKIFPEMGF